MITIDKFNEMLAVRSIDPANGGEVLMREITKGLPLLALLKVRENEFKVVGASGYVNKAEQFQISSFHKFFSSVSDAEEFFLRIWESDGFLAFGTELRTSLGSGTRLGHDYS